MTISSVQSAMRLYDRSGQRLYLNVEEGRRFLTVAEHRRSDIRLFAQILFHTGVRLSEACAIETTDIQTSANVIAIRTLKKRNVGHVREVHIPNSLAQELSDFCSAQLPRQRLFPVNRTTAWRWIAAIMAEAELIGAHATPKGLRHGFGVRAILVGVPLPVLQKWMGHARLETTTIYTRIVGKEERQLAESMFDVTENGR